MNTIFLACIFAVSRQDLDISKYHPSLSQVLLTLDGVLKGTSGPVEWDSLKRERSHTSYTPKQKGFFINFQKNNDAEVADKCKWLYQTAESQTNFITMIKSQLTIPFKEFSVTTQVFRMGGKLGDVVRERVNIEETPDGLFAGCNILTFTVDFRTGTFETIEFIGGWKVRRDTETIKTEDVEKQILNDGAYESKVSTDRWVPLSWTEKIPSGTIEIVKARQYHVTRGKYIKSYWFRTTGPLFMTMDNVHDGTFAPPGNCFSFCF
jgi:hypothetical protein